MDDNKTANVREALLYIYRCPKCGKFYETNCRQDAMVCTCGTTVIMSQPLDTIKHYKKSRRLYNWLTVLFAIILPLATLVAFMFSPAVGGLETYEKVRFKIPVLTIILATCVIIKGRPLLQKIADKTDITAVRCILLFLTKNVIYLALIAVLGVILGCLGGIVDTVEKTAEQITTQLTELRTNVLYTMAAVALIIIENTIAYCVFDLKAAKANYIIERAIRQSETIQAMEMSGR